MGIAPFRARRPPAADVRYLSNYHFQDAANILLEVPHFLKTESQQNSESGENELEIGKYQNTAPPPHSQSTHSQQQQHNPGGGGVSGSVHDSDGHERQNENPHDNEVENDEPQDNTAAQHSAHAASGSGNNLSVDDRNDAAKKNAVNKTEQSSAQHTHTPLSSSHPSAAHSHNYSRSDQAAVSSGVGAGGAATVKKPPSPGASPVMLPDAAFPNVGPLRNLSKQYVIIPKKSKKVKKNLTVCYYSLTIEKSYLANFSSVDFVNLSFYLKDNEVGYKTIGHQCVTNEEKRLAELNRDDLLFGEILPEGVQKLCDAYHLSVEDSNVRVVYDIGAGLGKIALQVFHEFDHVESVVGCELVESRIKRGMIAMKNYCSLLKIRNKDRRFEYGLQENEKVFKMKEKRYRERPPPAEPVQVHMKKISYDEEKRRDTPLQPPPPTISVFEERKEKKKDKKKSWKKPWKRFTFPFFSPASFDATPATASKNGVRTDGGALHANPSNGHGNGRGPYVDKSSHGKSERFVRTLELRNGNLFDLLSDTSKNSVRHADVVFADVNLSPAKYRDFCYFLLQLKNGVRIASYLDLTLLFAACHISCPFFRLSINQSIHDKFLTSWSPLSGHRFHLFIKLDNRANKDANPMPTHVPVSVNQTPNANMQNAPNAPSNGNANGSGNGGNAQGGGLNMPAGNGSVSCECKNCMLHRSNGTNAGSGATSDEPLVVKPMSVPVPSGSSPIASVESGAQMLTHSHSYTHTHGVVQQASNGAILLSQQGIGAAFESVDTNSSSSLPPKMISELMVSGASATGVIATNSTDSSGTSVSISPPSAVSAPFFPAKLQLDANGRAVLSTAAGICYVPLSALTVDGECIRLSAANVNGKLVFPNAHTANEAARIIVSDPQAHNRQEVGASQHHGQQYINPPASHPHVPSDVSPLRQGVRSDVPKRNVEVVSVSPAVFFAANSAGAVTLHDRSIVTVQVQSNTANSPPVPQQQQLQQQPQQEQGGDDCNCPACLYTQPLISNGSAANQQTASSGALLQLHVVTQDVHVPSQSSPSGGVSPLPVTPGPSIMNGALSIPIPQNGVVANRIFAPNPNASNVCSTFLHPTASPSSSFDALNSTLAAAVSASANSTTPTQLQTISAIQKLPPPTAPLNSASPSTSISSCAASASANSSANGLHMTMGMQTINLAKALSVDEQHWHPPEYEDSNDE